MTKEKRSYRATFVAFIIIFVCSLSVPAALAAESQGRQFLRESGNAFAEIAKEASPAVVSIRVEKTVESGQGFSFGDGDTQDQFEDFFNRFFNERLPQGHPTPKSKPQRRPRTQGLGSGFIISPDGYILTNNHVVKDADKIKVQLTNGKEYDAKIIGADAPTDVAVIKVDANNLPTLKLGDSETLQVGEWVIAIGNPFGLTSTLTVGVVSAKGRSGMGIEDYEDFIQTDAAINMGNSGGPLLNVDGKVVGINTAIVSPSGGSLGIGFAIPIDMVKSIYKQLIDKGSVTRGYLGIIIQQLTPELAKSFNLEIHKGILISEVAKDSPADKAGLKSGDVITELNDELAEDVGRFRSHVAGLEPGTKAELLIYRDGKEKTISVEIGKLPADAKIGLVEPEGSVNIGLQVQDLTADVTQRFGYEGDKGVVVTEVEQGSSAAEEGLQAGMLIMQVERQPVTNVDEFKAAVKKAKSKKSVLLLVKQGKYSRFVAIKLNERSKDNKP
ncbi:MAG: DegQ family serine endoprotease [Sedimentisphaerales bacterium]|nr:DegQ family serine endoprotease [Sedimentisphaerales bacterium]